MTFVKDDWWVPYYPSNNFRRSTGATCDGCHSVDFDITTHTVTENHDMGRGCLENLGGSFTLAHG